MKDKSFIDFKMMILFQEALLAENGATGGAETGSADMDMDSNDSEQVPEAEEEEQQEEPEMNDEPEMNEEPEMKDEPATEAVEPVHQNGDQVNCAVRPLSTLLLLYLDSHNI